MLIGSLPGIDYLLDTHDLFCFVFNDLNQELEDTFPRHGLFHSIPDIHSLSKYFFSPAMNQMYFWFINNIAVKIRNHLDYVRFSDSK